MAAPSATARQAPGGLYLYDGHPTKVTVALDPDISLWEKTVTPPGIDGGDTIDTTNMHNTTWRTMRPRHLKTLTEFQFTALYDPAAYTQCLAVVNQETTITLTFPDLSTYAFYGYLRMIEPDENAEGEPPTMTCTVQPTNFDPAADVEAGPTLVSVTGT